VVLTKFIVLNHARIITTTFITIRIEWWFMLLYMMLLASGGGTQTGRLQYRLVEHCDGRGCRWMRLPMCCDLMVRYQSEVVREAAPIVPPPARRSLRQISSQVHDLSFVLGACDTESLGESTESCLLGFPCL